MKRYILLIFLLVMVPFASADTITMEVWENATGTYFVTVGDGNLQQCEGTICNVEIDDLDSGMSNSDIEDLSTDLFTQLKADGFDSNSNELNESNVRAVMNDVYENQQKDERAWITNTWMPSQAQYMNCTIELEQKKGSLSALDAKFQGYDATLEAKEVTIDQLKRDVDMYATTASFMFAIIVILVVRIGGVSKWYHEWRGN
jgi:hypothetical protein